MPCENIVITIEETNEVVEIIINDFTVSNILSEDAGNFAELGTDGKVYVPTPNEGVSNHSELNLDDGTNPHGTTKSDVGLGNVPNLDTTNAINHVSNTSNPHSVTKTQVGLGNADNTSDADKPVSTAQQTALDGKANTIHSHVISDVTGLQSALNSKQDTLTDVNLGNFMDIGLATKLTPSAGDSILARDILTNEAIEIPFSAFVVGAEVLVTNASVTGTYNIDWNNDVWDLTLTGNTTLTESNLPASGNSKTITLEVSGNYTLTYPSGWTSKITGAYEGTALLNTITIQYYNGKYKVVIIQED